MPIPLQLGVTFTPAEVAAMKAAAQVITSTIAGKIDFNMSNEERGDLSKISDDRTPYVVKSINTYAIDHAHLNGQAYPLPLATLDLRTFGDMFEVMSLVKEAMERCEELQMVAGHFCFEFMRDQYDNAKKYRYKNVAGAQVVYDGLEACFEGQGPQNGNVANAGGGEL